MSPAAYKRKALECHPDKAMATQDESERERVEAHFLLVQEAQEHLSDPVKRREFDSIDEFDDSLPESCAPEDFFKARRHMTAFRVYGFSELETVASESRDLIAPCFPSGEDCDISCGECSADHPVDHLAVGSLTTMSMFTLGLKSINRWESRSPD